MWLAAVFYALIYSVFVNTSLFLPGIIWVMINLLMEIEETRGVYFSDKALTSPFFINPWFLLSISWSFFFLENLAPVVNSSFRLVNEKDGSFHYLTLLSFNYFALFFIIVYLFTGILKRIFCTNFYFLWENYIGLNCTLIGNQHFRVGIRSINFFHHFHKCMKITLFPRPPSSLQSA